jgi:hypothetical protein
MAAAFTGAEGAAAAHAAAVAQAIKAMGPVVRMEPQEFLRLIGKLEHATIVTGIGGFWKKKNQYLTNYNGIYLFTESVEPLNLGYKVEIIAAKNIWVPGNA